MILYREALSYLLTRDAPKLPHEEVTLDHAVGRVLAAQLDSPENLPPFTNSAMDGFALNASGLPTSDAPWTFKVNGIIAAGDRGLNRSTAPLSCWEIMTGAPLPADCDRVIKVEETRRADGHVHLERLPNPGENIRKAGEDICVSEVVAQPGTLLFPEHLMAFAALGIGRVSVYRRPKIAVISTGAELAAGESLAEGQIRNSTGPYLLAELQALGADTQYCGIVPDKPAEFIRIVNSLLDQRLDIILCTGGVSMGRYDFVANALGDLNARTLFHKVAIRPGKPLLYARLGQDGSTAFFGMPGNPIATAVGLRFFVEPYLRAIQGLAPERPTRAVLANDFKKPRGLRCFFKARTRSQGNQRSVELLKGQESFRVVSLLEADAWAILPEEGDHVEKGTEIEVFPLHSWSAKEALP